MAEKNRIVSAACAGLSAVATPHQGGNEALVIAVQRDENACGDRGAT